MDKIKVEAPIASVLVMEDRAQVTRKCNIKLEVGTHTLILDDMTPLIKEGNIQFFFNNLVLYLIKKSL